MSQRGLQLDFSTVNDMKEKCCYTSLDFQKDVTEGGGGNLDYVLPDGKRVMLGKERVMSPEVLFKPLLAGKAHINI